MYYHNLKLDSFQEEAIKLIEEKKTIIVCAPTGSGKTLIAEYAIEKYLKEGKKIIYTAPIKALSNQKYRDFSRRYVNQIGIVTGDVIINRDAPVLIMTTEIIRNIIFSDPQTLVGVEYIIFDEIHFLDDVERGTVWEESIIFAPQNIAFICLSATIPNIKDFSEWMQSVREIEVKTITYYNRPVPLKNLIYFKGFGIKAFNEFNWDKKTLKKDTFPNKKKKNKIISDNLKIIDYLQNKNLLPALYFIFNRNDCKKSASLIYSKNFLSSKEKEEILNLFDTYLNLFHISKERENIIELRKLLSRGIAYHHAGLMPAVKEIIERLYTLGLIKILFTTETFAVGINMPAKSVVFDSLWKHDGITFRPLTVREFQQMAGRAGRRGIDDEGYVFSIVDPRLEDKTSLKRIFSQEINDIESQINLSYSSLLNIFSRFKSDIFEVYEKSFKKFALSNFSKKLNREAKTIIEEINMLSNFRCKKCDKKEMLSYFDLRKCLKKTQSKMKKLMNKNSTILKPYYSKKIEKMGNKINRLKGNLNEFVCFNCTNENDCFERIKELERKKRELVSLKNDERFFASFSKEDIIKRLEFLKYFGYINGESLTIKGKIAEKIFGCEIQITELYLAGIFNTYSEDMINMVLLSLLYEPRKPAQNNIIYSSHFNIPTKKLKKVYDIINFVRKVERKFVSIPVINLPDFRLCPALKKWCEGETLEQILHYTREDEGDIIREFRQVVDFLRQMKRAFGEDISLRDKLSTCIDLIYRDEVDAEAQLSVEI